MKEKNKNYEFANIAVNAVIFTIKDKKLLIYLQTREKDPFKNCLELPGGLLHKKETAQETLVRKLKNITELKNYPLHQFQTFTDPKRDPRSRTISIGYIALLSPEKITSLKNFYPINSLVKLAFDHQEIVKSATKFLKQNINNQLIQELMPSSFPLNDLQIVYEVISQKKIDNRNFRKRILNSNLLQKAKTIQKNVNHRPASLYQFASKIELQNYFG